MFYKIGLSEKSMIADTALVLIDAFAPRFASIQVILDTVDFFLKTMGFFWLNFQVLASTLYMLFFSFVFAVFIFS